MFYNSWFACLHFYNISLLFQAMQGYINVALMYCIFLQLKIFLIAHMYLFSFLVFDMSKAAAWRCLSVQKYS